MEIKEKIKLLGDLQSAIDNNELKSLIEELPSGGFIWNKFSESMTRELDSLLSGKSIPEQKKLEELSVVISRLDNSVVVNLLRSLGQKLDSPAQPPASPGRKAAPTTQAPVVAEEPPESQEEMKRRWEDQQLKQGAGKSGARGSGTGFY